MAAVIQTVQNRNFNPSRGTPPLSSQVPAKLDLINMYNKYNSQLHFEISRRPQKRLLIALHEQEDELGALWDITKSQQSMVRAFGFYSASAADFIDQHSQKLNLRLNTFARLKSDTSALKLRAVRMMEILEEDHGKAIRVFTVVTLFFLPM